MLRAYKTEINPTKEQKIKINKTIGTCRYLYNLYISENKKLYEITGKFITGYDFDKWINNIHSKQEEFKWIKEVSCKSRKQSIMNAEKAFKNFFKDTKNIGFPKYKKKKDQNVKCYIPKNNKTDFKVERHRIKVPTFGYIRIKEYGYVPADSGVINVTISKKADRYYISVLIEEVENNVKLSDRSEGIGIDLGVKNFAVTSDGKVYKNINKTKKVKKLKKKLKREQRSLSRKYEFKKKRGVKSAAKNIEKQVLKLQKMHQRFTNIRNDYINKIVSKLTKSKPVYITIENLNVKGMMKNKHLSKAIAEQKFYHFKECLIKKCNLYNIELREVNRFYPSSKLCSNCGNLKSHLSLNDRKYDCDCCDITLDRDFNATLNLKYAEEYTIIT